MRTSSIAFLVLFGALFVWMKEHRVGPLGLSHHRMHHDSAVPASARDADEVARDKAQRRYVETLERELRDVEKRHRDVERALRDMDRSVRSLQDLVRKSRHELEHRGRHTADIDSIRSATLRSLEAELNEVSAGHHRLRALAEATAGRAAGLKARILLARAGVFPDQVRQSAERAAQAAPPERLRPLEALGALPDSTGTY